MSDVPRTTIDLTIIAEALGLIFLVVGGYILGGVGGLLLAVGACLLYEARA